MAEELFLDVYVTPDVQVDIESGGGGISAHNELTNLEYSKSGHTGFASASDLSSERIERITADTTLQANIDTVDAIARGKSRAIVFQTLSELDAWLAISSNVATLQIGDNFYIVERDVPDFWWDGAQKQVLEGEKVDLTDFYTKSQIDNKLNGKQDVLSSPQLLTLARFPPLLSSNTIDTFKQITSSGIYTVTLPTDAPLGVTSSYVVLAQMFGSGYATFIATDYRSDGMWVCRQENYIYKDWVRVKYATSASLTITGNTHTLLPDENILREITSTPTIIINATTFGDGAEATFIQTGAYTPTFSVTGLTIYYAGAWTSITPAANRDTIYMFKRVETKIYVTRNIAATTQL